MIDKIINLGSNPRLRQAAIAIAVALVVAFMTILRPLDITFWALQAKLPGSEPSGSIVIVTDETGAAVSSTVAANSLLLQAVENLDAAGAQMIVIETPLRASRDAELDAQLAQAIAERRDKVLIAAPVDDETIVSGERQPNARIFADAAPLVSNDLETDFLDFVWSIDPGYSSGTATYPALWTVLAGDDAGAGSDWARRAIYPDYRFGQSSLPRVALTDLAAGREAALEAVRGKRAVVTGLGGDERLIKAPHETGRKPSSAHISAIAAETAMDGGGMFFSTLYTIPAFAAGLLLLVLLPLSALWRRVGYGVWSASFIIVSLVASILGHSVMVADALVIGVAFGAMRATSNYRRRHLYIDAQSRLPNFTALRRALEAYGSADDFVIVIVKIARLDAIFATLKSHEQGEYLRQVASRLALGEQDANVYHDGGKYLGMAFRRADYADLQGHLEGLRAIASQAVMVEETPIDVAITIGVDQSLDGDVANRISSAIAAADQAREAYRPVFIISDFQADSEEWDHSLQSRLEAALSENRISVKLQPKVEMQTGLFVGAEALARWTDQQRGEIPPVRFILQCERAGRLDELTKRVMEKSMQAANTLASENLPSKVSVNVSAIQFVDSRIVDLVEMALSATGADPANIMIEITETARVENLARARGIMEEIKRLGITFSIDDFGVGSGNLDALYGLPFDELKIDRMFSNEVARCHKARAVVASMLELSRAFGMRSVVEGIDNLETFEMLRDMGGDLAQGFCIARPQTLPLLCETLRLQATGQQRRSNGGGDLEVR